ncbi:hypothetical protein TOPH_04306 [Tolypocladium ophioglossoides CBS 100239]|uniref:Uncharacterized protein n=1 Tax=Tolypocladium ophioglossoides (strain CBS 100239) TaxID=1163406 RepID=A0A0L0NAF5_TOLOC|nr:hypothetical protein TOPH_04306 [Tolypocladium ophioglossoides CBS 100239]
MKGRPVEELVLVPEVRQETHAFYGHLETQEAKYPGLDYNHDTHRIRLSRWPWHRRLFRAFNTLGLTHAEIAGLTKWEGTRWAKEKFEKEQGITIKDTTADSISDWVEPTEPRRALPRNMQTRAASIRSLGVLDDDDDDDDDEDGDEESDEELESVGVELNERLRAQAARREAGETSAVLDEEWEQWLKYAIETGELTIVTEQMTEQMFRGASSSTSIIPAALIPPSMLSAARAGQWTEIPEFLQPMLRRTLEAEDPDRGQAARPSTQSSSSRRQVINDPTRMRVPWPRRTYSDLRLPVGEAGAAQRTAEAPGA